MTKATVRKGSDFTKLINGKDGVRMVEWQVDQTVLIVSNYLPIKLSRCEIEHPKVEDTTQHMGDATNDNDTDTKMLDLKENEESHKFYNEKDDHEDKKEGSCIDVNQTKHKKKFTYHVEWAGDRLVESHNTFSHHQISSQATVQFIGFVTQPGELEVPVEDREEVERLMRPLRCIPIFVDSKEQDAYYEGYCKSSLWPSFHNVSDIYSPVQVILDENAKEKPRFFWTPTVQQEAWQAYKNVNRLFAQKVCESYRPGDVIWVHGYHLLLVPSYISRKVRGSNIGLYIHTPFPSSEVFRTLSSRKELLRGMLTADHIGFHLYEYARHFLSCCRRILGLSSRPSIRGQLGIDYCGRRVAITCSHMTIDTERIEITLNSPHVRSAVIELRQKYQGWTIFSGCDTIERLKGIPLKLLAFHQFLDRCPQYIGKVLMMQIGINHHSRRADYVQSISEIEHVVTQINQKYFKQAGRNVIVFEQVKEYNFIERLALWRVTDVQVTTVLRDGLNTLPFEYIATHSKGPGVVIVSEFSGCSRLLNGAITINPWEIDQVTDAMLQAITMSIDEKKRRMELDLKFISQNPPSRWAKSVLDDIVGCRKKNANDFIYMGAGFGLDFRLMEVNASFKKLQDIDLCEAYRKSTRRAIFLDYYRTLVPASDKYSTNNNTIELWPNVPVKVLTSLEYLCKDPRNIVFVVSGCERNLLMNKFRSVPGLGLVAEHGYFTCWGVKGNGARLRRKWEVFDTGYHKFGSTWPELVKTVMMLYVDRTSGSSTEMKESSVLFRYAKCDFEFGNLQAAELKEHLEEILEGWPLSVLQGKDYIEVRPSGVSKGAAVKDILKTIRQQNHQVDFILCIGDDSADELMFEHLEKISQDGEIDNASIFTCSVGHKPSTAKFYVDDEGQVAEILSSLRVVSTKSNRNYSVSDMQRLMHNTNNSILSSSIQHSYGDQPVSVRRHGRLRSLTPVMEEESIEVVAHVYEDKRIKSFNGEKKIIIWRWKSILVLILWITWKRSVRLQNFYYKNKIALWLFGLLYFAYSYARKKKKKKIIKEII